MDPFEGKADDLDCYIRILKNHFTAHGVVDDAIKRAILLAQIGLPTYKLLRSLCVPDFPESKTFDYLVELLSGHISPTPSRFVARWTFNQRCQAEGEKVSGFVAALHDLSRDCNYRTMRSELVRDRLVCGVSSSLIRSRLLELADDATLQATLDLAISLERAADNTQQLETQCIKSLQSKHVNHGSSFPRRDDAQQSAGKCHSCGGSHDRRTCKFVAAVCFKCQRKGHIAKVCCSRVPPAQAIPNQSYDRETKQHFVAEPIQKEDNDQTYQLFHARSCKTAAYKVDLQVGGVASTWEIDTGASLSIMPETMYKKSFGHDKLTPSNVKLQTYTGEKLVVCGEARVDVKYAGQEKKLPMLVVKHGGPALLD